MGVQISANYSNIVQTFTYDIWNIHSATHKTTNESVSLWIIDNDRFSKKYSTKQEKEQYFDLCLQSLQNIRKLRHPRILKILEINEKKPDIAFASEPVHSCIDLKANKMHPMDAAYISLQIAEVLGFLNQDARLAHLGLSPNAVILDREMSAKLIHFQWSTPITQNGQIAIPDKLLSSKVLTEYQYKPPEILSKREVTGQADVFIFGLFMYSLFAGDSLLQANTPQEILNEMPTRICNIYNVPNDFKALIQSCLSMEQSTRPSFLEILQNQCFQSMQLKSLKYIDMILTKEPQDKFKFYKGLSMKIEDFSPTLTKIKILPVLLNECKAEIRFAPILLGPILKIASNFTEEEFMSNVWIHLSFLTTVVNPPEVSIALLKNLKTLLDKIKQNIHKDHVYPIVFAALQSQNPKIHSECLQQIHYIIDEMNESSIRGQVLPRLLDLASNSTDPQISAQAIKVVKTCLSKIDNDTFAADMLPRLAQIWQKAKNSVVGFAIVEVVELLKASNDIMMTKAIPIAAEIVGSHAIEGDAKMRLCDWMITTIRNFKEQRTASNYSVTKASSDADNPFGTTPTPTEKPTTTINNTKSSKKDDFNAADIFGSSSTSSNTKTTSTNQQSNFNASDIFGSSTTSTNTKSTSTTNQQSNFNASDIFGSSTTSSNTRTTGTTNQQSNFNASDIFGSSSTTSNTKTTNQQPKFDATDIFGPPTSTASKSNAQAKIDIDVFGASSNTKPTYNSNTQNANSAMDIFGPPQTSNNQSTSVFRQNNGGDLNIFGSSQSNQQTSYMGQNMYQQPNNASMQHNTSYTNGSYTNSNMTWTNGMQNNFGQPNQYQQPNMTGNTFTYGQQPQQQNKPNNGNDFISSLF